MTPREPVSPEAADATLSEIPNDVDGWLIAIRHALSVSDGRPLALAKRALQVFPNDAAILHLAGLAALAEKKPKDFLPLNKRLLRYYSPLLADHLLMAIFHAQSGHWSSAAAVLEKHGLVEKRALRVAEVFWKGCRRVAWTRLWLDAIQRGGAPPPIRTTPVKSPAAPVKQPVRSASADVSQPSPKPSPKPDTQDPLREEFPELPRLGVRIAVRFDLPNLAVPVFCTAQAEEAESRWFDLRQEFTHLGLLQGFNELLCLSHLQQVDTYWYQVETVRKVLKQFRGRVLLADEVGLGKTIEAGMVLKEYILRGMANRILILTPASLVGQWQEEMEVKFGISCVTTQDPAFRADPDLFWREPRIIASLAVARREEQCRILAEHRFDLVIVDEAHHLRNRATRNWKLVDGLNKRFLILLTATPVQNSLVELYNLLTLLKPGIFPTEKEFRAQHVSSRNPRTPLHPDRLRELMRDVMIRNTRALVDVRLPPRHAVTMRVPGEKDELACYQTLSRLIREQHAQGITSQQKMSLHHLLTAAGSSPLAVKASLERLLMKHPDRPDWSALLTHYRAMTEGGKAKALLDLLKRNPEEKKLVFIHHRETIAGLSQLLDHAKVSHVRFEGGMNGPAKDAAVLAFRERVPVLLCSESGGEGRNLQFCNTLINFDLPWSPMTIEQRIGRIHRIGQTREVFIFNLALRDTVEDRLLTLLDEKLNLFELVVGEVDAILGEMDDSSEFAETIFSAWVEVTEEGRQSAFAALGERLQEARSRHEAAKVLDEHLFGDEFEAG
ncbi:MAG: DEAD/DEAH box helicase family protein [Magnetococcales bacterium]|nr:DEAD/DEAH box helicase family protein [Magnetococcales bacterium]MBF0115196.1 DEAD/DEAH box helicase family protein [Magnetococcales bacterium]